MSTQRTPRTALPLLVVELPVPEGREAQWNAWYHQTHMPDVLEHVDGIVATKRYRVLTGDRSFAYVVMHDFVDVDALLRYAESREVGSRWTEYEALWGPPAMFRRRGMEPIFEIPTS